MNDERIAHDLAIITLQKMLNSDNIDLSIESIYKKYIELVDNYFSYFDSVRH